MNRSIVLAAGMVLLMRSTLWAHAGHGSTAPQSVVHHLVEPVHCWWIALIVAGGAAGYLYRRYRSNQHAKGLALVRKSRQQGSNM